MSQALLGGRWVGLASYEDLLADRCSSGAWASPSAGRGRRWRPRWRSASRIALLERRSPRVRAFRTALVVPMMITPIVGALCWKLLLDPSHGVFNYWLGRNVCGSACPARRCSPSRSSTSGKRAHVALILLAGLRSLPSEPLEAASIDGAARPKMFWHVTLPLLRPFLLVALLLRTIFEFRAFDNIYALTAAGPADATMVLSMFTYLTSLVPFDFSLGARPHVLMLVMSMLMCLFFIAVIRGRAAHSMAAVVGSRRTRNLQATLVYVALSLR